MQQIERYGVIALVFLLVTIVAVSFWGDSKSPGFWARLTGKAKKQDVAQLEPQPFAPLATPPATTSEQALQTSLALNPTPTPGADVAFTSGAAPAPATTPIVAPTGGAAGGFDPLSTGGALPPASLPTSTPPAGTLATPFVPGAAPADASPAAQPELAPPHAPIVEPVPHEYLVQKGDSLARIARRTLGREDRWTEIQALNGGVSPSSLKVGMKLKLPAGATAAPAMLASATKPAPSKPATSKSSTPKATTATTAKKAESTSEGSSFYTVKKGDTLNAIAERRLGAKSRVREILALNPGLDPQRIGVGAKIKLPAGEKRELVAANVSPASARPQVR
jgi:nucleoid-associated protein YgaU